VQTFLKIHPDDNAAVALKPLRAGDIFTADGAGAALLEDIPQGHKFSLCDIPAGGAVIKYGAPIGTAREDIRKGAWIHTHNMKTGLGDVLTYTYRPQPAAKLTADKTHVFQGFKRPDGTTGVRNEIWIIPTVGCVNNVASAIEKRAQAYCTGSIEAILAFSHPYGCSQMGEDQENTRRILADLINHPNAGGVLVLGLGCENSSADILKDYIGSYDERRVKFLVCQESEDEIQDGLRLVKELTDYAGVFTRGPIPCSELIVGMKCGGSDGLSGITANPTVGAFSDLLIASGGTTSLTEVPEMFGAETLLMNRCENEALFEQTVKLINDFKNYFTSHNQTIYEQA